MADTNTTQDSNTQTKKKNYFQKKLGQIKNIKTAKQTGVEVITDLQTQVNKYPEFKSLVDASIGNNTESSIDILLVLAKAIGITEDEIIAWVYNLLGGIKTKGSDSVLDKIEYAIKMAIFLNIKNLLTCSVNPIMDDDLMFKYKTKIGDTTIGKGVKIKIDEVDMFGILKKSPNSTGGGIFYFDKTESQNDEWQSCDFNAFLWYVINKGSVLSTTVAQKNVWDNRCKFYKRISPNAKEDDVWGGKGTYSLTDRESFFNIPSTDYEIENEGSTIKVGENGNISKRKYLYCSYSPSDGEGNTNILTIWANPYRYYKARHLSIPKVNNKKVKYTYEQLSEKKITDKVISKAVLGNPSDASSETPAYIFTDTNNVRTYYKKKSDNTLTSITNMGVNALDYTIGEINNFGLNRTILEFNWDYIWSLKLFDTKTILANILNALTNGIEGQASFSFSYEQAVLKQEIQEIVKGIINADDETIIDDSYFTFSNADYDTMLENAAKERMSQYKNDETGEIIDIDSDAIIDALNNLDSSETSAGTITTISNAFSGVTSAKASTNEIGDDKYSFQWNFITKVINEFSFQMAMQLLSPKFAILYAFNSAMMGDMYGVTKNNTVSGSTSGTTESKDFFSIENFKSYMTNIIATSIRQIKNIIITELEQLIYEKFKILLVEAKIQWAKEKIEYYKLTVQSLLNYWNLAKSLATSLGLINGKNTATYIDNVDYADIIETKTEN